MKTQAIASTCVLIIGLYGMTPAVAESFQDRGSDWTVDSPMVTSNSPILSQTLPPDGSFASSWGSGKTPTQYEGPSSSSGRLATGRSCDLTPKVGFNQKNRWPTC
jgi:hypothetical protein